ncbi:hypothetical protein K7X08_026939 [Anisodus acutangulus]|uniref:Signal peptidase complex subunit 1 n=1 Tax=Anisodus acutangulus TaxID=402998 RepID=A0A9Q1QWE1_9SOLA|nr:hypothetical protein K7X08_026939 [Anisodus acutangulus]
MENSIVNAVLLIIGGILNPANAQASGQFSLTSSSSLSLRLLSPPPIATDGLARTKASRTIDADTSIVFTALVTIPNWPVYNRNPLKWLDPSEAEKHPKPLSANSGSKKKTTKNK